MKTKLMIKSVIYGVVMSILIIGLFTSSNIRDNVVNITQNLKPDFQKAIDATVQIGVGKKGGAGIIVKEDDEYLYIITVKHIVEQKGKIKVAVRRIDGILETINKVSRKNIYMDKILDVALVKVPRPEGEYAVLKLADQNPPIGTLIYTIGHPMNFHNTVNIGIVSNYIKNPLAKRKGTYMLISAPSIFGNSGGAVINSKTEVVGIASGIMWLGKNPKDIANTLYIYHMTFAVRLDDIKNLLYEAGVLQKEIPEVSGQHKILR